MTTDVYDRILEELQNELGELERRVFNALRDHPGGMTRQQLAAVVYHEWRSRRVDNNDTKDRKIRKTIESLRLRGVPIISTSGKAGYRMDVSPEGRQAMLMELIRRRDRLNELISRVSRFADIPAEIPSVRQERLL